MSDNKYHKSKIYRLFNTENNSFYIGCTIKALSDRLCSHKQASKVTTGRRESKLYKMMRSVGIDKWVIDIIEPYSCEDKNSLLFREQYWINEMKPDLNQFRTIVTSKQRIERNKEYQLKHKIHTKEQSHTYYQNKKEYLCEKVSCEECSELISRSALLRHYKRKHHDKVNDQRKLKTDRKRFDPDERITCPCGKELSKKGIREHERTKGHISKMKELEMNNEIEIIFSEDDA